jgi:NADPH2:quinone reductase
MQKTNGKGMNVIFDAVGGRSVKLGIQSLSAGGRIVCYGASEMTSSNNKFHYLMTGLAFGFYNPGLLTMAAKSIIGINMLRISDERPLLMKNSIDEVSKLAEQGVFKPVLGKVFPASEIAEAHQFMESRASIGKVVVEW